MRRAAQHIAQGNHLVGIEPVIDAGRKFSAVAVERLCFVIFPGVNLVVAVRKTAARCAEREIRVLAQPMHKAELRVQIHRRQRQPPGEVRAEKIRLVVIIIRVAGYWRLSFDRLVVTHLDEIAFHRVDLRHRHHRQEPHQPKDCAQTFPH